MKRNLADGRLRQAVAPHRRYAPDRLIANCEQVVQRDCLGDRRPTASVCCLPVDDRLQAEQNNTR
uniref:Uncharacterized protein n=1 Tax=Plectus sambesii TaxID=2011161 RepID=A0A914VB57_9BILA